MTWYTTLQYGTGADGGCCGCCSALKPRYKRLVDNIFPADPQEGLMKNNMEKLTFYALSSPEKLDRIGEYLAQRLSRDVHRHRLGFVFIAMEALDQLMVSCHAHSLNLFVESFLKMIQKLLECDEVDLQVLATNSFVKFANIEEDTPSYHRRYDFFVSKFSAMCHSNLSVESDRLRVRTAGLRGIQGVVRKTVTDDLQVNIWEKDHMEKIVPSLLYNMHDPTFGLVDVNSPKDEEHPAYVAEVVFRDLVCRASYGNIKSVIKPVLTHFDHHEMWVPNEFAIKCFKIIMYSVQQQYGYLVIQLIMSHLDRRVKSDPSVKASIIGVLYESVLISAGGSIGPSVLEVFNSLLRHLRISVDGKAENEEKRRAEIKFEEAVVNTIGQFANHLPDYQKIEIMMFIMAKLPQFTNDEDIGGVMDEYLQTMLLKTLLRVATKYKTVSMNNAFPPEFLNPLLRMSLLENPSLRLIVQEILHTLIDRHDNSKKLNRVMIPKDITQLNLTVEKCSRQDTMFMKKSGMQFYWHLFENLEMMTNKVDNFEAIYCTMVLIAIEMGGEDIFIELVRLALDMQQIPMTRTTLPLTHKCAINGLIAAFMNILSQLSSTPQFKQYVQEIIDLRKKEAPHLLPDFGYNRRNRTKSANLEDTKDMNVDEFPSYTGLDSYIKESWLFNEATISEYLSEVGHDTSRLTTPLTQSHSGSGIDISLSASDIHSINIEIESSDGSPLASKKRFDEEITVESLKKMLAEDSSENKEEQDRKRLEIVETFRTAPFEEIVARSEAKSNHFHNKLNEILDMVDKSPGSPTSEKKADKTVPIYDMQFPELFVY